MRVKLMLLASAGLLALSGCDNMTSQERMVVGGLTGASLGMITAKALDADRDWVIIGALAGAAAGTVVAQNQQTKQCAVALGDGTYRLVRC
ncbi:glycine zipper 2TM domain-containing protein [Thalassovita taeanensis]|uniref:17 kDa surface antigen n=1 Tax=Thalassovita taeanensis TaxID=657014 RepID=A0A1H9KPN8_9RHOB|nr:glucose-6-phosphate isomerase [Thalassovita taeanensis]SER01120.1 hypothetical protein SAMN04488092_1202 [Thalassovita taeanensis]